MHKKIYYEDSGNWHSLPDWAEYFISIGKYLATTPQSNSRVITAIAVPTRAYGAVFVGLGTIIKDAAARVQTSESTHFERLFDLPPGTPVIYRLNERKILKGILKEPQDISGKIWIPVQVQSTESGGGSYFIDESQAYKVQPAQHSGKLPKKQSGKNSRFSNNFVDLLLGDADPVQLGIRSKKVCAFVGRKNILEHEIRKTSLAVYVDGRRTAEGQLQDILRVNRFVSEKQSYRSILLPIGIKPPTSEVLRNVELSVIFDGALGFLKWGDMWKSCHQVIILDRTEAYFDDAINAVNTRYSQNRVDGDTTVPECDTPPGGEVLMFREAIN